MIKKSIYDHLQKNISNKKSNIIVGIDPDINYIPQKFFNTKKRTHSISEKKVANIFYNFGRKIIDVIHKSAIGVKLQSAFFERYRYEGIKVFFKLAEYAKKKNLFTIADVKRADIPNTAQQYIFSYLNDSYFDSMTIIPFFGYESIKTFSTLASKLNKFIFVVLVPTNADGEKLQLLKTTDGMIFEHIARMLISLTNVVGVVCKSDKDILTRVRMILPNALILIPGIGAQGGQLESIKYAFSSSKHRNVIVNISRSIIYPQEFGIIKSSKNWEDSVLDNLNFYKNNLNELTK